MHAVATCRLLKTVPPSQGGSTAPSKQLDDQQASGHFQQAVHLCKKILNPPHGCQRVLLALAGATRDDNRQLPGLTVPKILARWMPRSPVDNLLIAGSSNVPSYSGCSGRPPKPRGPKSRREGSEDGKHMRSTSLSEERSENQESRKL